MESDIQNDKTTKYLLEKLRIPHNFTTFYSSFRDYSTDIKGKVFERFAEQFFKKMIDGVHNYYTLKTLPQNIRQIVEVPNRQDKGIDAFAVLENERKDHEYVGVQVKYRTNNRLKYNEILTFLARLTNCRMRGVLFTNVHKYGLDEEIKKNKSLMLITHDTLDKYTNEIFFKTWYEELCIQYSTQQLQTLTTQETNMYNIMEARFTEQHPLSEIIIEEELLTTNFLVKCVHYKRILFLMSSQELLYNVYTKCVKNYKTNYNYITVHDDTTEELFKKQLELNNNIIIFCTYKKHELLNFINQPMDVGICVKKLIAPPLIPAHLVKKRLYFNIVNEMCYQSHKLVLNIHNMSCKNLIYAYLKTNSNTIEFYNINTGNCAENCSYLIIDENSVLFTLPTLENIPDTTEEKRRFLENS